ncbi:MAG TPA: hypothetical protein VGO87_10155 [Acidimicrobiia bacterium]|jgi:hypothetical protein
MAAKAGREVGWLCAGALLAASATASAVNNSQAALFGERTTAVVSSCHEYKGVTCEVSIPQRPDQSFSIGTIDVLPRDTEITVRYYDDAVVRDAVAERIPALAFLIIGLCAVGGFLIAAVARIRARKSPAALALAIAVPLLFFAMIFTSCVASFAN